jgi:hypothetical protein
MTATKTATVMRRSIWIIHPFDLLPLTLAHHRGGCKRRAAPRHAEPSLR